MILLKGLALLLTLSLLFSGCWSRRELTEVSFAGVLGIDWKDGNFQVTVVINSPRRQGTEGSGSPTRKVWTISEQGPSLDAALARMDQSLDRSLTLHHVRAIVFGEAMARQGIGMVIDFMLRSVEIRPTAWVAVTNGEARTLLEARPRQDELSEGPLGYQDSAQRRNSLTMARRLTEVGNILQEEGIELTLPLFRRGDEPGPKVGEGQEEGRLHGFEQNELEVQFGGAGVFKGDKLVGWLTADETRGHLWVKDRIMHGAIIAQCPTPRPGRRVVFRLRSGSGKVYTRMEGGELKGYVKVKVVADVNEINCDDQMMRDGDVSRLESVLRDRMHKILGLAIAASKEYESDFIGFGQTLFRHNPTAFTTREKQWGEILSGLPVAVEVETQIPRLGQLNMRYRWRTEQ